MEKYSTSLADAAEILRNLANALSLPAELPSAMLAAMEIAALRICAVNACLSSLGKFAVLRYTASTKR